MGVIDELLKKTKEAARKNAKTRAAGKKKKKKASAEKKQTEQKRSFTQTRNIDRVRGSRKTTSAPSSKPEEEKKREASTAAWDKFGRSPEGSGFRESMRPVEEDKRNVDPVALQGNTGRTREELERIDTQRELERQVRREEISKPTYNPLVRTPVDLKPDTSPEIDNYAEALLRKFMQGAEGSVVGHLDANNANIAEDYLTGDYKKRFVPGVRTGLRMNVEDPDLVKKAEEQAKAEGYDSLEEWEVAKANEYMSKNDDYYHRKALLDTDIANQEYGSLGNVGLEISEILGSMVPSMALGNVSGALVKTLGLTGKMAWALQGIITGGEIADRVSGTEAKYIYDRLAEEKRKTRSEDVTIEDYRDMIGKAKTVGELIGIAEAGTEMLFGGLTFLGKGLLDDTVAKIGWKLINEPTKEAINAWRNTTSGHIISEVVNRMNGAIGEGMEEAIMSIAQPAIEKQVAGIESEVTLSDIARDFGLGAAVSLVVGIPVTAVDAIDTAMGASSEKKAKGEFIKAWEDRLNNLVDAGDISKEDANNALAEAKDLFEGKGSLNVSSAVPEEKVAGEALDTVYDTYEEAKKAMMQEARTKKDGEEISVKYIDNGVVKTFTTTAKGGTLGLGRSTEAGKEYQRIAQAKNVTERSGYQLNVKEEIIKEVSSLSKAIGREVEFYRNDDATDHGYMDKKTGKIYINAGSSQSAARSVIAHELTHQMENTAGWSKLVELMKKHYGSSYESRRQERIDAYEAFGKPLKVDETRKTYDEADQELVAMFVEEKLLTDADTIREVVNTDKTLAQKIIAWINKVIQKLAGNKEQKMLVEARDLWNQALTEEQAHTGKDYIQYEGATIAVDAGAEIRFSQGKNNEMMKAAERYNEEHHLVDTAELEQAKKDREYISKTYNKHFIADSMTEEDASPIQKNGSYGLSVENTSICSRSLIMESMVERIANRLGRPLNNEESIVVASELRNYTGDQAECLFCYQTNAKRAYENGLAVYLRQRESVISRFKSGMDDELNYRIMMEYNFTKNQWTKKDSPAARDRFNTFIKIAKGEVKAVPALYMANTRVLEMQVKNPANSPEFIKQLKQAEGYAQGASRAHARIYFAVYEGQILEISQDVIDRLNSEYGLRMFSYSDFSLAFLLENMQMVTDASVVGLQVLSYTKNTDFVEIFAGTDMAINMSLAGFSDGKGGYICDGMQSMEWEQAKKYREQYPYVGTVYVAFTDEEVVWAVNQDWIDTVIPFHISGGSGMMQRYQGWKNYSSVQSESKLDGWDENKHKAALYPTDHQNNKEEYLRLCKENHLRPKFAKFLTDPRTKDNYMKLVNETRVPPSEMTPVRPVFNLENVDAMYERFTKEGGYGSFGGKTEETLEKIAEDIYQKVLTEAPEVLKKSKSQPSPAKQRNDNYIQAVVRRDMETAHRLMEEAANDSMKSSKVRDEDGNLIYLYHGTDADFSVFDTDKNGGKNGLVEGFGIYTTDSEKVAESYGNRKMKLFANIKKPATSTSKTIKKPTLVKLIKDTCEKQANEMVREDGYGNINDALRDTWISNYVFTYDMPIANAYEEVATIILDANNNDMDIIREVMAGMAIRDYSDANKFYKNSLMPVTKIDGFITEWTDDSTGEKSKIVIPFVSNQLKSAETVTRDDAGNIIPLTKRFKQKNDDTRYSIGSSTDAEYMEAVESGDMTTAQRMVDEAAKAAGYVNEVYHGTHRFGFTVPDISKSKDGTSFFATDDPLVARSYSGKIGATDIGKINKTTIRDLSLRYDKLVEKLASEVNALSDNEYHIDEKRFRNIKSFCRDGYFDISSANEFLSDAFEDIYASIYDEENPADLKKLYVLQEKMHEILQDIVYKASKESGNYRLYAKNEDMLIVDGPVRIWNNIDFSKFVPDAKNVDTRYVAEYAKEHGYKGAVISNLIDYGTEVPDEWRKPATVYVYFEPQKQLKSADPVTYDENDNIIPLSERFNEENNDIRWSVGKAETARNYFVGDTVSYLDERASVVERNHPKGGPLTYTIELENGDRLEVTADELQVGVTPELHFDELPKEEQEAWHEPPADWDMSRQIEDVYAEPITVSEFLELLYENGITVSKRTMNTWFRDHGFYEKHKKKNEKDRLSEKGQKSGMFKKEGKDIMITEEGQKYFLETFLHADKETVDDMLESGKIKLPTAKTDKNSPLEERAYVDMANEYEDEIFDTGIDYWWATLLTGKGVTYSKDYARNFDAAAQNNPEARKYLQKYFVRPLETAKADYASNVRDKLESIKKKMAELGIQMDTEKASAVQWIGEGQYQDKYGDLHKYTLENLKEEFPDDWENIKAAEEFFREMYDQYLKDINQAREKIYPHPLEDAQDKMAAYEARRDRAAERIADQRAIIADIEKVLVAKKAEILKKKRKDTKVYANLQNSIRYNEERLARAKEHLNDYIDRKNKYDVLANEIRADIESGDILRNKRIIPRKDYFHHFQELTVGLGDVFSMSNNTSEIDPRLEGTSGYTEPRSKFSGVTLHRKHGRYKADAIEGMVRYVQTGEYMIHIDPVISEFRNHIVGMAKVTKDSRNANKLIRWLVQWTNDLAGKTNPADRWAQDFIGRETIKRIKKINSIVKANAVVGNFSSATAQFFNFPNLQAYVNDPKAYTAGLRDLVKFIRRDKDTRLLLRRSGFMNERYLDDAINALETKAKDKISHAAQWTLVVGDRYTSAMVWFTAYNDAVNKGKKRPIEYADDITRRCVAGRGIGEIPLAQKALITQVFAPFQIEVNNAYQLYKEKIVGAATGRTEKDKLVSAGQFGLILVMNFLMNSVTELINHQRVVYDPIYVFLQCLSDWKNGDDDDEEKNIAEKFAELLGRQAGEIISNIPYGSLLAYYGINWSWARENIFGDQDPTRFGVSNIALDWAAGFAESLKNGDDIVDDVLSFGTTFLMPFGGKQTERTLQGLVDSGILPELKIGWKEGISFGWKKAPGSYDKNGQLQFPLKSPISYDEDGKLQFGFDSVGDLGEWLTLLAFGKYATDEGQKYLGKDYEASTLLQNIFGFNKTKERTTLSERATEVVVTLAKNGSDVFEVYDTVRELQDAENIFEKRNILAEADLTDAEKAKILLGYVVSEDNYESTLAKMNGVISVGLGVDDYLKIANLYSLINDSEEYQTATEKTLLFNTELASMGYTSDQIQGVNEVMAYFSHIPADTSKFDELIGLGLSTETTLAIQKTLGELEPLEGETQVSSLQKAEAIAGMGLSKDEETAAMAIALDDNTYVKYKVVTDYGVDAQTWVDLQNALDYANANNPDESKRNKSFDKEEKKAALDSLNVSNETRAALWQILDNQLYSTDPKHNTAWKAGRNPYSSSVGAQVVEACIEGKSALAASKETDETESAYTSPVSGDIVINSEYGYRIHPISGEWKMHHGLDIDGEQGDPVFAAAEGTVVKTVNSNKGYGNYVIIEHADGTQTLYAHMYSYGVEEGQTVSQGEQIGEVGSTGGTTGPHLHFEVRVDGQSVNPQTIFDFTGEGIIAESDPNYAPIVSGGGSSGGGSSGGSSRSGSTASVGSRTSQVASNRRSGSGIYLPTASGSSVGRSGRSSSVAGMSTSAPAYGTRGVYLPKASDYTSGGSSIRSSVATTQRTGRTGGSFWNG